METNSVKTIKRLAPKKKSLKKVKNRYQLICETAEVRHESKAEAVPVAEISASVSEAPRMSSGRARCRASAACELLGNATSPAKASLALLLELILELEFNSFRSAGPDPGKLTVQWALKIYETIFKGIF